MGPLTVLQKLSLKGSLPSNLPASNGQLTALQKLGLQSGSAWAHPGPGGPPPGPSPGTNPADGRRKWTSSLTALHKVGLDGDQLNSLPESSGQLGWETVSNPCPGEPSRLDHIGAPAGGEDTSITSMRRSIMDETVVLGMDWARTDRLPSIRGFRPGVLGGARRKVAQDWHRGWEKNWLNMVKSPIPSS